MLWSDAAQILSLSTVPSPPITSQVFPLHHAQSRILCLEMILRARSNSLRNVECSVLGFALCHALLARPLWDYLSWLSHHTESRRRTFSGYTPSVKLLIASMFLWRARYANVASGDPSLIIKWTVIKLLNTTVHVESRSRFCNARNTSATPASPEWVAIKICSMYLFSD